MGLLNIMFALLALTSMSDVAAQGENVVLEPKKSSFRSQGEDKVIYFDSRLRAVALDHSLAKAKTDLVQHTGVLNKMNLKLIWHADILDPKKIIGIPVWFDRKMKSLAILTRDIVVKLQKGSSLNNLRDHIWQNAIKIPERQGLYILRFKNPLSALKAANQLSAGKHIKYAHPDFLIPRNFRGSTKLEVDPLVSSQWHVVNKGRNGAKIGADAKLLQAWKVTQGKPSVVIAVIDGGFDPNHPDLASNWQNNANETPDNKLDDDQNGYIDDFLGWNFWYDSNDIFEGGFSDHGVAVAGLVAAPQNDRGVMGACPKCRVLPIVVGQKPSDDARAFYYAKKMGAQVITNSWGYPQETPITDVVVDAINHVALTGRNGLGTIILFAMNNINKDDCIGKNPDISALPSVVAVSGVSDLDKKVSYTAYGNCMELLSPTFEFNRSGIATTDLLGHRGYNDGKSKKDFKNPNYTNSFSGTSAATPIVAGVVGLMLSMNPQLSRESLVGILLATADKVSPEDAEYDEKTGFSKIYGYGRVNAYRAVGAVSVLKQTMENSKILKNKIDALY